MACDDDALPAAVQVTRPCGPHGAQHPHYGVTRPVSLAGVTYRAAGHAHGVALEIRAVRDAHDAWLQVVQKFHLAQIKIYGSGLSTEEINNDKINN